METMEISGLAIEEKLNFKSLKYQCPVCDLSLNVQFSCAKKLKMIANSVEITEAINNALQNSQYFQH